MIRFQQAHDVKAMLGQRPRRRPNIKSTLFQNPTFVWSARVSNWVTTLAYNAGVMMAPPSTTLDQH